MQKKKTRQTSKVCPLKCLAARTYIHIHMYIYKQMNTSPAGGSCPLPLYLFANQADLRVRAPSGCVSMTSAVQTFRRKII